MWVNTLIFWEWENFPVTQILEAVRKKVDTFDQIKVKTVYMAEKKNPQEKWKDKWQIGEKICSLCHNQGVNIFNI